MYFAFSIKDLPDESLIPAGWYTAQIIRCDIRDLRSGDGQRLILTYQISDGPYAGRTVDAGFNVDHPNPKAVEISQKEVAKVLRACGLEAIQDTLELHGRAHQIRVGIETYKYREQNRVMDWRPLPLAGLPSASMTLPPPSARQAVRQAASQTFQTPPPPSAAPVTPRRPAASTGRPAAPVAQFLAPAAPAPAPALAQESFDDDIPF